MLNCFIIDIHSAFAPRVGLKVLLKEDFWNTWMVWLVQSFSLANKILVDGSFKLACWY